MPQTAASSYRLFPSWTLCGLSLALLLPASSVSAKEPAKPEIPVALANYVAREEPAFRWELRSTERLEAGTIYTLFLVSQEWQGIVWEHDLQVFQPAGVAPRDTMLLWNQGGNANEKNAAFGMDIARRVQSPVAFLYGIPKQPLYDGKKEDTLIAETFVRYLETGDDKWPLLFPMVKSLVKAMDALQSFSKDQWQTPVAGFVVSGASKRGWTTWLTAAADPRVKAIAPMVIDTLNMRDQGPYQLKSFGKYSEQINDYTQRGLVPMPDTPEAKRLWSMVDPWIYRERLTIPKMIINGANDPYWTTDALNLYWNDLPGNKWVLYVPNAGHNLEQHLADGRKDRERALNALAAFTRHTIRGIAMPQVAWNHDDAGDKARLTVKFDQRPKGARVWMAAAPTRDFRLAPWKETAATIEGAATVATVPRPDAGHVAFFAELDYDIDGLPHQVSTQMRILDAR
ncbi:MAG: PhoPQ-activated pathogenicity-related family protein [Planctomycetales bacterium]